MAAVVVVGGGMVWQGIKGCGGGGGKRVELPLLNDLFSRLLMEEVPAGSALEELALAVAVVAVVVVVNA